MQPILRGSWHSTERPSCNEPFRKNYHTSIIDHYHLQKNLPKGNVFTHVCHSVHRGVCIPACITGHMTKHYISSCTGDQSHLVQGQYTGNIKCISRHPLGRHPLADTRLPSRHPLPPGYSQ